MNIKRLTLQMIHWIGRGLMTQLFVSVITLFITLPSHSQDAPIVSPDIEACRTQLVNQDLDARYATIQKKLEKDFSEGMPQKLRKDLVALRKQVDKLSLLAFDLNPQSRQEMNLITQQTIDSLDKIVGLLPKASSLAPQVREQYVVPFTNISSIRAEQQECMMKVAVAEAQSEAFEPEPESSGNLYKKLTSEMKEMNKNLYRLETTDVQKFITLRANLLKRLSAYNENPSTENDLGQNIPVVLNSLQSEIEKVLPGLQLSKKYYSIVD